MLTTHRYPFQQRVVKVKPQLDFAVVLVSSVSMCSHSHQILYLMRAQQQQRFSPTLHTGMRPRGSTPAKEDEQIEESIPVVERKFQKRTRAYGGYACQEHRYTPSQVCVKILRVSSTIKPDKSVKLLVAKQQHEHYYTYDASFTSAKQENPYYDWVYHSNRQPQRLIRMQ